MKLGFLAFLAFVGCAPCHGDVTVYVADGRILAHAESSAAEWNACGGRMVYVRTTPANGAVPVLVVEASEIAPYTGLTHFEDGEATKIRVTLDAPPGALPHELGHVLMGPEHFGSGLMSGKAPNGDHVTKQDCDHLKEMS